MSRCALDVRFVDTAAFFPRRCISIFLSRELCAHEWISQVRFLPYQAVFLFGCSTVRVVLMSRAEVFDLVLLLNLFVYHFNSLNSS